MEQDLAYRLSESMAAFYRANMNRRSDIPVRSSEMGMLIYIALHSGDNGVRAIELSDYFGIRKSSVSAAVVSLERQGYIRRMLSEEDKRSTPLFPTEKGSKLVNEAFEEYQRISNKLIAEIGLEKCEEFLSTLNTVTKIIQNGDEDV
jgi:DNA-binding MarR family transcriptional regulator